MNDSFKHGIERPRRSLGSYWENLIEGAIRTRLFPEVWYLTQAWLGSIHTKNILVLGYGLGLMSEALAKSGWDVTTADPSLIALKSLKSRFARAKISGQFQRCELEALPFEAESFHAVIALNTIEFCQNPLRAIGEVQRVLVPHGQAVVTTVNRFSPWNLNAVVSKMHRHEFPRDANCLSLKEFKKALEAMDLKVATILPRARYLPLPKLGLSFHVPIPGVYVGLVAKK